MTLANSLGKLLFNKIPNVQFVNRFEKIFSTFADCEFVRELELIMDRIEVNLE